MMSELSLRQHLSSDVRTIVSRVRVVDIVYQYKLKTTTTTNSVVMVHEGPKARNLEGNVRSNSFELRGYHDVLIVQNKNHCTR
jgi:hypothetical protein